MENLENGRVKPKDQNLLCISYTDHKRVSVIDPRLKFCGEYSEYLNIKKYGSVIFQAADTRQVLTRIDGRYTFKADQGTYPCPVKFEEIFNGIVFEEEKNQSCRFYVENLDNGIVSPRDQNLLDLRHADHKRGSLMDP